MAESQHRIATHRVLFGVWNEYSCQFSSTFQGRYRKTSETANTAVVGRLISEHDKFSRARHY